MDPGQLIPTPDALPAPWGFFNVLLILTFTLHLLLANAVLGGAVIALVRNLRAKWRALEAPPQEELTGKLPILLALTINLGVAPLLFLQVIYGQYIYSSAVLMAGYWLSIFALLILGYYALYVYKLKFASLGVGRIWPLVIAVASLLVVSFFFTSVLVLMINPGLWSGYFTNQGGTILPWSEPTLFPRYLHFVLGSLAVGGLAWALWGRWQEKHGVAVGVEKQKSGLIWYGVATLIQFPIGALYLGALPNKVLAAVMTGEPRFLIYFFVSIITGLASAMFAFGRKVWPATITAVFTVLLMVLFRGGVRTAYLAPYLKPSELPVSWQPGALVMFLIALAVGLGVAVYLIKLVQKSRKEAVS